MSFDTSSLNEKNLPWRWRRVGEWMLDTGKDMSVLDSNYREALQVAGGSDYGTSRPAITNVSVDSASAGSVVFNISTHDDDVPVTFDMDKSANAAYNTGGAAPTDATTDITVTSGQWTDSSGPAAGQHAKYVFAATDSDSVEGPLTTAIEVVIAPAAISDLAAVDADTTGAGTVVDITFTESPGSVSTTLYWMATGGSVQDVIDNGTAVAGATTGMTVDALAAGDFDFVLVSTNPGGSTPVASVVTATVSIAP